MLILFLLLSCGVVPTTLNNNIQKGKPVISRNNNNTTITPKDNNNLLCGQSPPRRLAFVWYLANSMGYPCAILASVQKLRTDLELPHCIETVVIYNSNMGLKLESSEMATTIAKLNASGLVTRFYGFDDIPQTHADSKHRQYYHGVLTKLSIFRLSDYDRILFMDADTYPLMPLHFLLLGLPGGSSSSDTAAANSSTNLDFWAIRPSWLPSPEQQICSVLLILRPCPSIYQQIQERYFITAPTNNSTATTTTTTTREVEMYDMNILQDFFRWDQQVGLLPGSLLVLDGSVEAQQQQQRSSRIFENAALLHFSIKKPWHRDTRHLYLDARLNVLHKEWKRFVKPYCPDLKTLT